MKTLNKLKCQCRTAFRELSVNCCEGCAVNNHNNLLRNVGYTYVCFVQCPSTITRGGGGMLSCDVLKANRASDLAEG
jgi:hypothetical protein